MAVAVEIDKDLKPGRMVVIGGREMPIGTFLETVTVDGKPSEVIVTRDRAGILAVVGAKNVKKDVLATLPRRTR